MSKVLVLGAGASLDYGYPTGSELRQKILDIDRSTAKRAGIIRERFEERDMRSLVAFQESFRTSQMYSVDAFLGRRPKFSEMGKWCIAAVLLACENSDKLFSEKDKKDHWYQYLLNRLVTKDWVDLTFNDLSIVSFNYDRSLEHFLYVALQSAYGKSADDAAEKLKALRIVHVYGALSKELPNSENYLRYDGKTSMEKVQAAASEILVIPEGRAENPTFEKAREWLSNAQQIAFLGFGFDPINVARLAEGGACGVAITRSDKQHVVRYLCGTRLGVFDSEMEAAFLALTQQDYQRQEIVNFQRANCTETLRTTRFFDR